MKGQNASLHDLDQRRAGIRRTAWAVAAVALTVFVLFFVKQFLWH
jgi:hypothetical protein